jgi:putative tryptophan/tyrosine transport system substrate-binding protein
MNPAGVPRAPYSFAPDAVMERRAFIGVLAGNLLAAPLAAEAQTPGRVTKVGILSTVNPRTTAFTEVMVQRLRELGYVEGQNLVIEFRNAKGDLTRLPALAAELVRLNVDIIVASGPEATLQAARRATATIPIVIVAVDFDPIARGYVASLAKPGGNVTGVFLRQIELTSKRMQFLKEALPNVTRVAVFWDTISADQWREADQTAPGVGLTLQGVELRHPPYDLTEAFRTAARGRAHAVLLLMSPIFFPQRAQVAELGLKSQLPTICGLSQYAHAGALMSYGANLDDMFRHVALYIDKILKGAKPADLPVEQPTKFELLINLKTAKALGLTIPPSLLHRADQVIE